MPTAGPFGMQPNLVDNRREKTVTGIVNTAGVMEVDNALTGGPITLPGDGDEP